MMSSWCACVCCVCQVSNAAANIAQADVRAEEVSSMARQLLAVLRGFPRREELAAAAALAAVRTHYLGPSI